MAQPYRRRTGRPPIARILLRLDYITCPVDGLDGDCWIFQGAKRKGYGSIRVDGKTRYTHQLTYEVLIGPLPPGEPDHLCKVKACCNPWHLRYGTHADNLRTVHGTLTHCSRGHLRRQSGQAKNRRCAECAREDHRAYMRANPHRRGKR